MKGGEGKGKTSFPPNWLFQSLALLKSLEEQCTGLYLTSVDQKYASKHIAEGYVDSCNAGTADQQIQRTDTPEIITERMRVIAKTWADLIHGSGGEVSLSKSCWWLVWWNWKKGKASLASVEEVEAQIQLTNRQTSNRVTLKRRETLDAIRQLGLENDLLGGQKTDYKKRPISTGVYNMFKKECETLMSPFLNTILPKLGLNHHFLRVVLHGAKKYGGL
eukprot:9202577-Ditylum_brightwellii.AAC.1